VRSLAHGLFLVRQGSLVMLHRHLAHAGYRQQPKKLGGFVRANRTVLRRAAPGDDRLAAHEEGARMMPITTRFDNRAG
jgi:hypothetical protein